MRDFGDGGWIVGNKQHRCELCYGPILKGESHYQYKGMYDGEWQNWRMHKECHDDFTANAEYSGDYEFSPGDAPWPERIREIVMPEKPR